MLKILFVCLGNICRSPAAEAIFKDLVLKEGLQESVFVDSAGTSAFHAGEAADSRMREHAKKRGHKLLSRSRAFCENDLSSFDYIVVMDESNYQNVLKKAQEKEREKVLKMADFAVSHIEDFIPDPYYGGSEGFEKVLDMLEESSKILLNKIKDKGQL